MILRILFENDQDTSVEQRNVETLNDQTKTINLEHNENICQIYNSNSKWNKSDRKYADVNYVHVDQLPTNIQ